ncbi:hypothetical protein FACS1894133_3450 [Clostridia bacterium]|nr:hypothetical protein FACS1894133_3450 [Clostridia bacterium]
MQARFGVSMSGLKVFRDSGLEDMGQRAYARGNEIHIAGNESVSNERLMLHEATHVVQQGTGAVRGGGLMRDSGLEAQANSSSAMASYTSDFAMPTSGDGPIQGWDFWNKFFNKKKYRSDMNERAAKVIHEEDFSKYEDLNSDTQETISTNLAVLPPNSQAGRYYRHIQENPGESSEETANWIYREKLHFNPIIRYNISLQGRRDIDAALNNLIFRNTLYAPTDPQKTNTRDFFEGNGYKNRKSMGSDRSKSSEEALRRNNGQRKTIAKSMLWMQAGNFTYSNTKEEQPREYDLQMSEAYSYGGRTAFVLPGSDDRAKEKKDAMFASLMGKGEDDSGLNTRLAGTHGTKVPKTQDGGNRGLKEYGKSTFVHRNTGKHYGMDVAVGGIGNEGVKGAGGGDNKLMNDGTCGHMYINYNAGKSNEKSVILMGLETSASLSTNQFGKFHSPDGSSAKLSSTGAVKKGGPAGSKGTRTVDLSMLEHNEIIFLDRAVDALFDAGSSDQVKRFVDAVSGTRKSPRELAELIAAGNEPIRLACSLILTKARQPQVAQA